jgi:hypothetical protein
LSSSCYRRYVVRFRKVTRALLEADGEVLRALELELPGLPEEDQRIARMAIHDVSRKVPMRGAAHFARALADAGSLPGLAAAYPPGSSSALLRSHSS